MEHYNFTIADEPGAQYHRAGTVRLTNPRGTQKQVTYEIESITNTLDGKYVSTNDGYIYEELPTDDSELRAEEIKLVGLRGEDHGKTTAGEMIDTIMLYLNSHMIHVTNKAKAEHEQRLEEQRIWEEEQERIMREEEERRKREERENAEQLIAEHTAEIERLRALLNEEDPIEDPEVPVLDPEVEPDPEDDSEV